jgi:hypothetical protein
MQAFLQGARHHGWRIRADDRSADAVVIWSVLWAGRMRENRQIYEHFRNQGKPVFVIDVGSLRRNITWKVALTNITCEGYYGNDRDLDVHRPLKLGLELHHQHRNNGKILIAGQHPLSLQMKGWNTQEDWINHAVDQIRQHTDRDLIVRPHPRSRVNPSGIRSQVILQSPRLLANTYDSFDLEYHYHAVINHNSGVGIQSAVSGCRPVVDRTSLAYPVSVRHQDLESPYDIDRKSWFLEICHTEYLVEEMAQGLCMQRLADHVL